MGEGETEGAGPGLSVARAGGAEGAETEKGAGVAGSSAIHEDKSGVEDAAGSTARAKAAKVQVQEDHAEPTSESDAVVPKAAHDAR